MELQNKKQISVITITYNSKEEIKACIDAVIYPHNSCIEMVVIDNLSTDGTVEFLQQNYSDEENIQFIFNKTNTGFAYGCNQGVSLTTGKYILLLNPDTVAAGVDILKLAEYLDNHPQVGIVGPKIIDEQGITQESYGYDLTPWNEIVGKLFYSRYFEIIPGVKKWKNKRLVKNEELEVGWIGGACTLIRRELYNKVGGIDTAYFLSHADMIDLGKSIKNLGFKIVLYPRVKIVHAGSRSIVNNREMVLERAYRGTLYFFKKYYGFHIVLSIKIIYVVLSFIKALIAFPLSVIKSNPYRDIARAHAKNAVKIITGKIS